MSIQLNSKESIQHVPEAYRVEEESIGCWQRFKNGVGLVISKVICFVSVVGKIILWPLQIISILAFKALGVIWPDLAARAEAFWGHLMLIGERVVTAAREEELLHEIDELQEETRHLREKIDDQIVRIEEFRVNGEQQLWEEGMIREERDAARRERDQRLEGRTRLTLERDQLKIDKQQLEEQLQEAVSSRDTAIQEKNGQQIEHDQALQEVVVIRKQLEQVERNDELLEQFRKIDHAYENRRLEQEVGEANATELELQQLIPIYDAQKEAYKLMIEQILDDLSPEHELQVPLQGILRLFNEEVDHLKRISEEMHFYAELKGPLNLLRKTVN
jgi:hypothetical protein